VQFIPRQSTLYLLLGARKTRARHCSTVAYYSRNAEEDESEGEEEDEEVCLIRQGKWEGAEGVWLNCVKFSLGILAAFFSSHPFH